MRFLYTWVSNLVSREKRATGVIGSINFQVDWLNLTNHERISFLGQQAGKPDKCRFYYFHAWLSERLKGEEEEIRDTSAELAAPLIKRIPESLLCSTEHSDAICLSSSEDPSSAALDKEMGGLWVTQPALAIHCCSLSRNNGFNSSLICMHVWGTERRILLRMIPTELIKSSGRRGALLC